MKRCKDEARMKEPLFREKWNTDAPAPLPTSVMSGGPTGGLGAI